MAITVTTPVQHVVYNSAKIYTIEDGALILQNENFSTVAVYAPGAWLTATKDGNTLPKTNYGVAKNLY